MAPKISTTESPYFEVRNSGIHGTGLFASRSIPSGTRVVEYLGRKISKAVSLKLREALEANDNADKIVLVFDLNQKLDIDGDVPENVARYANHHCEPNLESVRIRGKIWLIALRDIAQGEELTFDYGFKLATALDHPCRCGAVSCPGFIVETSERLKLRRMLQRKKSAGLKKVCAS